MKYICCLLLFMVVELDAQTTFMQDYLLKWDNGTAYTLEFAEVMPATEYGFTPTNEEMVFSEQLKHVAGNMVWLCSTYLKGSSDHIDPTKVGNTKNEIVPMLEKVFAYARTTVKNLSERDLNEQVNFISGPMSRRRLLLLLSDHVTHHRGQLVVYLRLKNIEPPRYRGW